MDKNKLICRTCRGTYDVLYSLVECKNGEQTIAEMLATVTPELNVQTDDELPKHICDVCYNLLNIAYNFHQMCITSDKQLRAYLAKANNPSITIKQENDGEVPICMETLEDLPSTEGEYDPLVVNNEQIKVEETEGVHENKTNDILLECNAPISNNLTDVPNNVVENENNIVCQICLKTFKYNKVLFRHLRMFHNPKSVDSSAENSRYHGDLQYDKLLEAHKPVDRNDGREPVCQICLRSFKYRRSLYRHLRDYHVGNMRDIFNTKQIKATKTSNKVAEDPMKGENKEESQNVPSLYTAKSDDLITQAYTENTMENNNPTPSDEVSNVEAETSTANEIKDEYRPNMPENIGDVNSINRINTSTTISEIVLNEGSESCTQEKKYACSRSVLQNTPQTTTAADRRLSDIWKVYRFKKEPNRTQAVCEICSKIFTTRRSLYRHLKVIHEDVKNLNNKTRRRVKKTYICEYCNETFRNDFNLKRHRTKHTGEILYLCPYCGKSYSSQGCLNEHVLRHTGQKRFQCPICPSKFVSQKELSHHATTHTKIFPHVCDICGSKYKRASTLKRHKQIHSGRRPYKCEQCGKTFVFNKVLLRHKFLHTGEKPHKCTFCSRAFAAYGDLNKHLRLHVGEKTYKCKQCPMAFKYKKELRDHENKHIMEQQQSQESNTGNITPESHERC